jgi:hypothetical protein
MDFELKIGRSAVRPRPWPLYLACANYTFLDLFLRVSSQLSASDFFAVPVANGVAVEILAAHQCVVWGRLAEHE